MPGFGPVVPSEEYFDKGVWGYDGSQWRKLAMLWGFSDRWVGQASNLSAGAGVNYLELAAVPSGEVWTAYVAAALNVNTNPAAISFGIKIGVDRFYFWVVPTPGANVYAAFDKPMVFKAGDIPSVAIEGCTALDDIYARWWGYKMAVT